MSIINANPLLAAAGGDYQISRSVRLRSSATAYFNRTFGTPTSGNIFTWSGWVKRGAIGAVQPLFLPSLAAGEGAAFTAAGNLNISVNGALLLVSSAVYRDPSAWYHIMLVSDMGNATASLRFRVYVNGSEVTAWSTDARASYTSFPYWNKNTVVHYMGYSNAYPAYADGYLTEINFIDGQALTPSSFGETDAITGVWKPKRYTGTYGTNGFYLNFSDPSAATAAAIGKDYSGNGNNWTPNNISVTTGVTYDSMLDVPTPYADGGNGRGNYAVLNPLLSAGGTTANGNLQITTATGVGHSRATIALPTSGKWYCEFTAVSASASDYIFGIVGADTAEASYGYNQTPSYAYTSFGERVVNGSFTSSFYSSYTGGDVIGCAVDLDTNQLTWYKNGVAQTAISITNGSYFWMVSDASGSRQITAAFNAGQRPFAYTPPTGFVALNTQNLPEPTIKKGNQYFDAVTRNGFGSTGGSISSLNFQPDFLWNKTRNISNSHNLIDSVRGVSLGLSTNLTAAEQSLPTFVTSFNSNGYTMGTGDFLSTTTIVDWVWKESPSAGFDIVTYTGTLTTSGTVAISHSLGVAPKLVISKSRNNGGVDSGAWFVWTSALSTDSYLRLNTTAAAASVSGGGGGTMIAPTSSVFYTPYISGANISGATYVAYLFAEVAGFSRFGSFVGNGSTDGPFVYCGFRPKFILFKNNQAGAYWVIHDTARNTYNIADAYLWPNDSSAEATTYSKIDVLSNGFKCRSASDNINYSGYTTVFAAFAENPFKNSLAR